MQIQREIYGEKIGDNHNVVEQEIPFIDLPQGDFLSDSAIN